MFTFVNDMDTFSADLPKNKTISFEKILDLKLTTSTANIFHRKTAQISS